MQNKFDKIKSEESQFSLKVPVYVSKGTSFVRETSFGLDSVMEVPSSDIPNTPFISSVLLFLVSSWI